MITLKENKTFNTDRKRVKMWSVGIGNEGIITTECWVFKTRKDAEDHAKAIRNLVMINKITGERL